MRTMEVYTADGEFVTRRKFETDEACYDWFHDNYGEPEYRYVKIG